MYIQTPSEGPERIEAVTQRRISDVLTLAQKLGGTSLPFRGPSFHEAVAEFVREYGITHIVVGRTQRPWYSRWFGQSVLDRLLREARGVDVLVADNA